MRLIDILNELDIGEKPIGNLHAYNQSMRKGIGDKVLFMEHIKPDFIMDFGCADGVLIQYGIDIKKDTPQNDSQK